MLILWTLFTLFFFSICQQYEISGDVIETSNGFKGTLELIESSFYSEDDLPPSIIKTLNFQFFLETENRVRLQIRDANNDRWEVPYIVVSETPEKSPDLQNYDVVFTHSPFSFQISRKSDGSILFDTKGFEFFFADQYLEMSTSLSETNPNIYGLGERVHALRLDPNDKTYVIFNKDQGTPVDKNLYGHHPFYLQLLKSGKAHGAFFLNSNAQEFQINGPSKTLTYRTIGGIFDIFFFMGDTPSEVVKQYQEVIGRPNLPPFWSLGYHQCRWGYVELADLKNVIANFKKYNIPLETIWNDLDYMDEHRDWTVDPDNYPLADFQAFLSDLKANHQHYVQLLDVGLPNVTNYEPYISGKKADVFIKESDGVTDLINEVWPGLCVFPDLHSDEGEQWFKEQMKEWYDKLPISGQWIDMNEVSGFCAGECSKPPIKKKNIASSAPNDFDPMNPWYVPGGDNLNDHTLSMDGVTKLGIEYNVHSLYGFVEGRITQEFLEEYYKERSFIVSRSTFAGSGRHVNHWLGDNNSAFEDLYYSITGCLSMSLFGISSCGADICGFSGNTWDELCDRWFQVGSFYSFMRNHNTADSIPQEPYHFQNTLPTARAYINIRYQLLPYLYTLLFESHAYGETTMRPLFFEFPNDDSGNMPLIDRQFLWGSALLMSPVTRQGHSTVNMYIPDAIWYDFYTGEKLVPNVCNATKTWCEVSAILGHMPIHIRGGYILPMKVDSALTTYDLRNVGNAFLIALDENQYASGRMVLDDGISLSTLEDQTFTNMTMTHQTEGSISTISTNFGIKGFTESDDFNFNLDQIVVYGVSKNVTKVMVQGELYSQYAYDEALQKLSIYSMTSLSLVNEEINIQYWK